MIATNKYTSNAYPELSRSLKFHPVMNTNPIRLTKEQISNFNDYGYITEIDIFTADEAASIKNYFNSLMQKTKEKGHGSYAINGWHSSLRNLYDIICDSRISDVMQDLIGENLICWGSHFFCKEPYSNEQVAWHQDISYWPMSESKTITVWLAIDDVDETNAAMQVIPKSHLHGQINFTKSSPAEKNVLNQTIINAEDYGLPPVSINLKAGQIQVHSDLLVHGSGANHSNKRRAGLTMRFVPPEVIPFNGWGGKSILTRGKNTQNHWKIIAPPTGELIPDKEQKK